MTERDQTGGNDRLHNNKHHGPQGIDKAPGEETPHDNENFVAQTQKGKNQVDGDLSKEEDRPLEEQDLD
jgi:hypothetical protein